MRRTQIEASEERRVLQWVIASDAVFQHVHATYDAGRLCESALGRTVSQWIQTYARTEQDKAPGAGIRAIYDIEAPNFKEETESSLVRDFLGNLSRDWTREEPQSDRWAIDQVDQYFRKQICRLALEKATNALAAGDYLAAEDAFLSFSRPAGDVFRTVDLLRDSDIISDAFTSQDEVLFHMPGALGEMLGPIIAGDFFGILAPQKRGKSFMVDLVSISAMHQGVDVLLIDFEMTQKQKARRLWSHYLGQPRLAGEYSIPCFRDNGDIGYQQRKFSGVASDPATIAKLQKGALRLSSGATIQFCNVPSRGATMRQVSAKVKELRKGKARPFLCVADSGDYLRAEDQKQQRIDQLDEIWGAMRSVSQVFERCAMLSPSHTGRQTSDKEGRDSDVSGDIRKLWKLTKSMFLNRTKSEAEYGIIRASTETLRDGPARDDQVVILQALGINRPYLDSRWLKDCRSDLIYSGKKKSDLDS